jgi:large-conductance mechanosensitive channel
MRYERKSIVLLFVVVSTVLVTASFEFIKQTVHPNITIWESHLVTIIFNTAIATIAVLFAIKQYSEINKKLNESNIEQKKLIDERSELIFELQSALYNIKKLSGLLPICMYCKKIRNEKGDWKQLEAYISEHSETEFSHGICPDCMKNIDDKLEGISKK